MCILWHVCVFLNHRVADEVFREITEFRFEVKKVLHNTGFRFLGWKCSCAHVHFGGTCRNIIIFPLQRKKLCHIRLKAMNSHHGALLLFVVLLVNEKIQATSTVYGVGSLSTGVCQLQWVNTTLLQYPAVQYVLWKFQDCVCVMFNSVLWNIH